MVARLNVTREIVVQELVSFIIMGNLLRRVELAKQAPLEDRPRLSFAWVAWAYALWYQ